MKALAVAVVVALVFPAPTALAATAAARIEGRVFGADLVTPAAGLAVQAYPEGAKAPAATVRTDREGRFRVGAVPACNYVLVLADAAGRPLAAAPVTSKAGQRSSISLALPDRGAGQSPLAPGQTEPTESDKKGIAGFFQSTGGAVVTLVASAVVLALLADAALGDDDEPPPPVSPSAPTGD